MTGDAYLIEKTLQLADDGGNLRSQVVRVHSCHQFGMTAESSGAGSLLAQEFSCADEIEWRDCV